jgi:hypothetical protein
VTVRRRLSLARALLGFAARLTIEVAVGPPPPAALGARRAG